MAHMLKKPRAITSSGPVVNSFQAFSPMKDEKTSGAVVSSSTASILKRLKESMSSGTPFSSQPTPAEDTGSLVKKKSAVTLSISTQKAICTADVSTSNLSVNVNPPASVEDVKKVLQKKLLAKAKEIYERTKKKASEQITTADPAKTVCIFHMSGRCEKQTSCPFSHERPDDWEKPLCKQYSTWFNCRWGDKCLYLHKGEPRERKDIPTFAPVEWTKQYETDDVEEVRKFNIKGTKRRNICRAFQSGKCARGVSCWFMHLYSGVLGETQGVFNSLHGQSSSQQRQLAMRVQPYPATSQPLILAQAPLQQVSNGIQAEVMSMPIAAPGQGTSLPAGWSMQFDPIHKCCYYFNMYSGESQWEEPKVAAVPKADDASMQQTVVPKPQRYQMEVQQAVSAVDKTT